MAAKILNAFKQNIAGLDLVPSDGGRFEIEVDGEPIYSKLQTGTFPDEDDIVEEIRSRM